ncbi:hypothetical protein D3C87_1682700 [compost metagenome]
MYACFLINGIESEDEVNLYWFDTFRPIPREPTIKEIMLDKWKRQGLDCMGDDLRTPYCLESVFNFIIENFDVKEKK